MGFILAENKNLSVTKEYEKVFLSLKNSNRKICIGDFYGDPQTVAISNDESFCVMGGCGLIIYYLHEPFEEFKYNTATSQWKELFRENGKEWWIEDVEILDDITIMFTVEETDIENGGRYRMNIDSIEPIKCN